MIVASAVFVKRDDQQSSMLRKQSKRKRRNIGPDTTIAEIRLWPSLEGRFE
jgi:hypothetical protein